MRKIEPTDEMEQAYDHASWENPTRNAEEGVDYPNVRDGLTAVLALVDRDQSAALTILADMVDPDPCWYDHHGYCQAHGWTQTEPRCPHARARELLAGPAS